MAEKQEHYTASRTTKPDTAAFLQNWLEKALPPLPFRVCIDCWQERQLWSSAGTSFYPQIVKLTIHHPGVLKELVFSQDPLVIIDAYLAGNLDLEGTSEDLVVFANALASSPFDLVGSFKLLLYTVTLPSAPPRTTSAGLQSPYGAHTPSTDQEAIRRHYDLGNDFYKLWLDAQLVYSCAYFDQDQTTLAEAQEKKLDLICRKLRLGQGDCLCDVGCGWGALLRHAALNYGCRCYGITLSQEQLAFNKETNAKLGLSEQIQVELKDYRDLPATPAFDKVVSVGMLEHVGIKNYRQYFQKILGSIKPGGLFLNHAITTSTPKSKPDLAQRFIDKYIFPGGELATISHTLAEAESAGWEIVDVDAWRPHYARTLRAWESNLSNRHDEASALVGAKKVKLWQLYLMGSALAFEGNKLGIFQTLLHPHGDPKWSVPLTRQGWLS